MCEEVITFFKSLSGLCVDTGVGTSSCRGPTLGSLGFMLHGALDASLAATDSLPNHLTIA